MSDNKHADFFQYTPTELDILKKKDKKLAAVIDRYGIIEREVNQIMIVGTGDIPAIIHFYEKNGFSVSHRISNFFTDNYDHPIFENGIQLKDMVYLSKEL